MYRLIQCLALNIAVLCATPAWGDDVKQAEYNRLAQEIEKLASRNAWAGVERTYTAMIGTGATLSHSDHLAGAHSARARGDVTAARERLMAANEMREDREILDWLWEIDSQYGRVFLAADKNSKHSELQCPQMPFNPDQRRAVEFAQAKVEETGIFDGYLPQGKYTFGWNAQSKQPHAVHVVPRVQSVRIDTRKNNAGGMTAKEMRQLEKEQKRLHKERQAEKDGAANK